VPSQLVQRPPSGHHPATRPTLDQVIGAVAAGTAAEHDALPGAPAREALEHQVSSQILECLDDPCALFDADGRLLFCNRAYREVFDRIADRLVAGTRLEDLVRAAAERGPFGGLGQSVDQLVRRCLQLHRHPEGTCEIRLRDDRRLRIRARATSSGLRLDHCAVIRPAESRREADTLSGQGDRGQRQRVRDHADASSDWLWETDPELRFTYFSEQFSALTGIPDEHMIGQTRGERARESGVDGAKLRQHEADLRARRPFRDFSYCLAHPATGAVRHVRVSGRPIFDRTGRFLGYRGTGTDVTAEVEATQSAARAEARLRDAIESINDGFALFDEADRLVICNRRFSEVDALGADLTPGTPWVEILRAGIERGQYALARGRADAYVAQRLEHHRRADGSALEQRLADGRWIQIGEYRTSDGGTVSTRADITELKRRETARVELSGQLRTQYARFDAALNNMIQGLCMFDADQRLIVCNERYLEMYGFSPDVVRPGITLREIMEYSVSLGNYRREDAERAIAERPTTADKREQAVLHQRLEDGRVIAVMHQPMADGGSVATYEDVTQTVRAEEALREYAQKLERSNRELQDFASIASHDLQEPLRKIEAFGDRLKAKCAGELSDLGRTYIDRMQDAATRMRSLINDLLTYSQVTTKARPFVPVDLGRIAAEVMSDLQVTIEQAGARIELGDLPVVEADPTQMRQLLQNLLSNALKFRRQGVPPVVRISGRLRGREGAAGGSGNGARRCEVTVADNGIGFKPDYAGRIFGIFQRLHGRNEYPGTGIGLATCRKILERHGGTVRASSQPGEGATFVFTLPIEQTGEPVL
jgi:PAS domain S-box-containing protein